LQALLLRLTLTKREDDFSNAKLFYNQGFAGQDTTKLIVCKKNINQSFYSCSIFFRDSFPGGVFAGALSPTGRVFRFNIIIGYNGLIEE